MKTQFKFLFFAAMLLIISCTKEGVEVTGLDKEGTTVTPLSSSSFTISAAWEEGATTMLNGTAHAAQTNTVTVWNDYGGRPGKVGFQRWDQTGGSDHFGRTNGPGNDGVANHAFGFKRTTGAIPWDATVPFAYGTKGSREAIWTPTFTNPGIPIVSMGLFATDNGTGDEDATAGIIKVGNFRALDEDVRPGGGINGRVVFQKWNGSTWQQIGRTNGPGDNGDLLAFTVIDVRTDYSVSGGKVTAQTPEMVPIAKIKRTATVTRLSTAIYGSNVGSLTMYQW
jgi:hypothetical protein